MAHTASWSTMRRMSARVLIREFRDAVVRHRLFVYSSAVAYRFLVATIPLVLLGLALLGALGLRSTWERSIRPAVDPHFQQPVAHAIDYSVEQIFSGNSAGLIAFAALWVLWNLTLAVRIVMEALNLIHNVREQRSFVQQAATAVGLAAALGGLLVLAVIVMSAAPLVNGSMHLVFGIGRWIVAPALLALAVGILFRYAPAERPEAEWASAGSVLVVLVWLGTSAIFVWWVTVANYKSPTGNLTVFLTITLYLFITSAIFLFGAQLDELLRKKTDSGSRSRRRS